MFKYIFYIVLIMVGFVLGITTKDDLDDLLYSQTKTHGTFILERIEKMSKLTTTRYVYSSIVTGERDMPPILGALYGDQMAMVAIGYVTAGINLEKLTEDNIQIRDSVLTLDLPAPQLQDCFLNESESYVISRNTGLFAAPAPNLDTETRRYAVHQFRSMALEEDILTNVQVHAKEALNEFFSLLDIAEFEQVQINIAEPDSANAELPESCR